MGSLHRTPACQLHDGMTTEPTSCHHIKRTLSANTLIPPSPTDKSLLLLLLCMSERHNLLHVISDFDETNVETNVQRGLCEVHLCKECTQR